MTTPVEYSTLLPLVLPLVLGPLTSYSMDLFKKASVWVSKQSDRVKQLIVVGLAILPVEAMVLLDVLVPSGQPQNLWETGLVWLLTAGVAFATKNLRQSANP